MERSAMAPREAPRKMALLSYGYILLYIVLSSGQIFFNKWILSSRHFNFPFPVSLTLIHMVFSSVLCFVVLQIFKVGVLPQGMTLEIYATSIFPIGAMFAMTLWLGNSAYLYISVAFAQMLKAIMPVAVFLLGAAFGLENPTLRMLFIMLVISFGVLVASYGEIDFHWNGVIYQLGGVVGESMRLILIELTLKRKGLKLDPLAMMYYVSPCSAFCLFIPWLMLEKPKLEDSTNWNFNIAIVSLNALCTFALNISVFLVISCTSALTIRVAGVVRDWMVVLVSGLIFLDTTLTVINVVGYAIAIVGVIMYNKHKLEAVQTAPQEETNSLVPESQGK